MLIIPENNYSINNCSENLLRELEPYFSFIEVDSEIKPYINSEQKNTLFDLSNRVFSFGEAPDAGIKVSVTAGTLSSQDILILKNLNQIVSSNNLGIGSGHLNNNISISINHLDSFEKDLIFLDNDRVLNTGLPATTRS